MKLALLNPHGWEVIEGDGEGLTAPLGRESLVLHQGEAMPTVKPQPVIDINILNRYKMARGLYAGLKAIRFPKKGDGTLSDPFHSWRVSAIPTLVALEIQPVGGDSRQMLAQCKDEVLAIIEHMEAEYPTLKRAAPKPRKKTASRKRKPTSTRT